MKRKGSQSVVEEAGQGARTQAPHGRATMKRGPVSMGGERLAERRLLRAGAPPCLLACHRKPNQEQDRSPRPTTGLFALLCLSYLLGSSFAPPELTPGFPIRTFLHSCIPPVAAHAVTCTLLYSFPGCCNTPTSQHTEVWGQGLERLCATGGGGLGTLQVAMKQAAGIET